MSGVENPSFNEETSETESSSANLTWLLAILPSELADSVCLISDLKGRQVEVVSLLAEGRDNRAIAAQMGISESTVKQYITSIMLRIHVESRLQVGIVGFALKAARLLEGANRQIDKTILAAIDR